ncbi:hypothetical protein FOS14_00410 [Skermania sp. ID1734]|uniref:phosphatase PAP2 family protein n=1 Tax=Skermania sp. ID1734 TaxID=2597516 RepID=UPI00117CDA20|nr:phosphatase PAP2 family protein [Skermania sp. ID1734]TSE01897.1 hypothetical protein FOS14_00410 [Skermania sp. ID1734]
MRTPVAIAVLGCLLTVLLPLSFPANGGATGPDDWASEEVTDSFGGQHSLLSALAEPSVSTVLLPIIGVAFVILAFRRRWYGAAVVLIGPLLAVAVNSWVLKPIFDRHLSYYLAYPSGHTVSLIAVVTALALVTAGVLRMAVLVIGALAMLCAAIGMIGLGYHHLTDIVGGIGAGAALVIAWWLLLGWLVRRRPVGRQPDQQVGAGVSG